MSKPFSDLLGNSIVDIRNEDELSKDIMAQADLEMQKEIASREQSRLAKTEKQASKLEERINSLKRKLDNCSSFEKQRITTKLQEAEIELNFILEQQNAINSRLTNTQEQVVESRKERLIRKGKITPFAKLDHEESEYQDSESSSTEDGNEETVIKLYKGDLDKESRDFDDGNEAYYQRRLENWVLKRRNDHLNEAEIDQNENYIKEMLIPNEDDGIISSKFRVPAEVYKHLFPYQKTCAKWLWELYEQQVGGILGDEMGLGKTIQIVSFVAGLAHSGLLDSPVIIVCPATVLKQWVQEFHKWYPPLRVAILHSSGSAMGGSMSKFGEIYSDESENDNGHRSKKRKSSTGLTSAMKSLLTTIKEKGHVLVTTYAAIRLYNESLTKIQWAYCVLDEGHKIRNPDAAVTLACKKLKTPHRIILSGTPIQNNLTELWSLYDFVYPGRLGTLPVFQAQISIPINIGGYANASNIQVQTAYKCACILRDLISPYLLRRVKADVAKELPQKQEQVLFCKLTEKQRTIYQNYLSSSEVNRILTGKLNALSGIDILRKICNHPDLLDDDSDDLSEYGAIAKSGKLVVCEALLKIWKEEGHRVLLFSQSRQMLDILVRFVKSQGYRFLRMDGTTPIQTRSQLVDQYNNDNDIYIFLLTTRVGGLGINLTGADRVIIYDPDWNPSNDIQARERAWRLGQTKNVTIYRLMTSGTIEEKIYQRQIYKQFLTNKILIDPRQQQFFKTNTMKDLFVLGDSQDPQTETGEIFGDMNVEIAPKPKRRKNKSRKIDIDGVENMEDFKMPEETSKETEDDRILNALFNNSSVHSVIEHDKIVGASRPETAIVEREAEKVAQQAVNSLKKSRAQIKSASVGIPTWTGRNGVVGAPGKSAGLQLPKMTGSASILAKLREKNGEIPSNDGDPESKHVETVSRIRDFIISHKGKVSSGILVSEFKVGVSATDVAIFRRILKKIAVFNGGFWTLKPDFL